MSHFVLNPNFANEFAASDGVAKIVEEIGSEVLGQAIAGAEAHERTGDFARSMKGRMFRSRAKNRPYYRVWSDDPGALSIEFGNHHEHGHRIIGRAIGSRY